MLNVIGIVCVKFCSGRNITFFKDVLKFVVPITVKHMVSHNESFHYLVKLDGHCQIYTDWKDKSCPAVFDSEVDWLSLSILASVLSVQTLRLSSYKSNGMQHRRFTLRFVVSHPQNITVNRVLRKLFFENAS